MAWIDGLDFCWSALICMDWFAWIGGFDLLVCLDDGFDLVVMLGFSDSICEVVEVEGP